MSKPWIDLTRPPGWLPWYLGVMVPLFSEHVAGDWEPFYAIRPRRIAGRYVRGWIERRWIDDEVAGGYVLHQYRLSRS